MKRFEYYITIALTFFSLFISINIGSPLTFIIFLILLITTIISSTYPLIAKKYIHVDKIKISPNQIYKNQQIKINLSITNKSIIPIFLIKVKLSSELIEQSTDKNILYLKPQNSQTIEILAKAIKRGYIEKIHILLQINLFFEIFPPIQKTINTSIYIYPNFAPINFQKIITTTQENLSLMYKLTDEGDFFSIREYQTDDVKKIAWKQWAKTGKLVVKQNAKYSTPKLKLIINNLHTEENENEIFIEKINSFIKYLIANHTEIYLTTIEKIDEFQKIVDLKNSLTFLAKVKFLKSIPQINLPNSENIIIISNQKQLLETNLLQLTI